jgi:serine-type D-Ala-D-Ala carboxypeptidase (penicillin-binding protein 5/6)
MRRSPLDDRSDAVRALLPVRPNYLHPQPNVTLLPRSARAKVDRIGRREERVRWWLAFMLLSLFLTALLPAFGAIKPGSVRGGDESLSANSAPLVPPSLQTYAGTPPEISATNAYVWDVANNREWGVHADDPVPMASTTKIMTAVVAITYGNLDQLITIGPDIAQLEGRDASRMCCPRIVVGQQYPLRVLLAGLLLPSGDDAAIAIADGISGSQVAFVTLMNNYAAWLGLTHTHYMNPHGLDQAGHYTSARDLAHLTRFALTMPIFRDLVSQPTYIVDATSTHPMLVLNNTNIALGNDGIDGVKTGYTGNAQYCVVLHADSRITVILGDDSDADRFFDGQSLLRWAAGQSSH